MFVRLLRAVRRAAGSRKNQLNVQLFLPQYSLIQVEPSDLFPQATGSECVEPPCSLRFSCHLSICSGYSNASGAVISSSASVEWFDLAQKHDKARVECWEEQDICTVETQHQEYLFLCGLVDDRTGQSASQEIPFTSLAAGFEFTSTIATTFATVCSVAFVAVIRHGTGSHARRVRRWEAWRRVPPAASERENVSWRTR